MNVLHTSWKRPSKWSTAAAATMSPSTSMVIMIIAAMIALAPSTTHANDDQIDLAKATENGAAGNHNIKPPLRQRPDHSPRRPPQWLADMAANRSAPPAVSTLNGRQRKLIRLEEAEEKQHQKVEASNRPAADDEAAPQLFQAPGPQNQAQRVNDKAALTLIHQHKTTSTGNFDTGQGFQSR